MAMNSNKSADETFFQYIPDKRGPFVYIENNEILGWHRGVHHWTIGQGCRIGGMKQKFYVIDRDPITQTIYVVGSLTGAINSGNIDSVLIYDTSFWQGSR